MFVKRDHRKVDEILQDANDKRECLRLSKRSSEFQGTVRILCKESKLEALANLRSLNLYDNALTSVQGMGILSQTPVEDINLGSNNLASIPLELGALKCLKSLWLDDNKISEFPVCLCQLDGLETLRLSGNDLQTVPPSISNLQNLRVLALDNNELKEFPLGILQLNNLRHLLLRQNHLEELPADVDKLASLETLSVSSNQLTALPDCLSSMQNLQYLYANGNHIVSVPADLCTLPRLLEVNLSNNSIQLIPESWIVAWGERDCKTGKLEKSVDGKNAIITLLGNPLQS